MKPDVGGPDRIARIVVGLALVPVGPSGASPSGASPSGANLSRIIGRWGWIGIMALMNRGPDNRHHPMAPRLCTVRLQDLFGAAGRR
ncbi:hypothetical protein [Rhodopila sp.]|uniref:hypothetical protein n=1 Tax=Rhodopila sp. TaxID=2480087 RepID=UPI002C9CB90D|nr:hypothetical protein [Rhodopila sp.]HVZ10063.1 hypothetical protein [Rhodopila sp.]